MIERYRITRHDSRNLVLWHDEERNQKFDSPPLWPKTYKAGDKYTHTREIGFFQDLGYLLKRLTDDAMIHMNWEAPYDLIEIQKAINDLHADILKMDFAKINRNIESGVKEIYP